MNEKSNTNQFISINLTRCLEVCLYIIGIICVIIGCKWYNADLQIRNNNPFRFYEESYVGGDAYNYIISASRSTAIALKSIFWIILGGYALILGRLFHK